MADTILQHWIVVQFILPFTLVFAIVYALLAKTKILGEGKQVNAIIAGVIGLIFVSALEPKLIVENMILFLTVAIVIVFVVLILWGFVSGGGDKGFIIEGWMKWVLWIVIGIAVIVASLWATGVSVDFLFKQSWSNTFWTNFIFVAVVAAALAVVLKTGSKS